MNINKIIMVPTETFTCNRANGFIKNKNCPCFFPLNLALKLTFLHDNKINNSPI